MSLRVWLPLNGTLDNQGLDNIAVTLSGGIAVENNGKIGKCYNFAGTNGQLLLTNLDLRGLPQASFAFWCCPVTNLTGLFQMSWETTHRVQIGDSGITFRDSNNSSLRSVTYNTTFSPGKWAHVVCIYNRGQITIYVNGVQTNHSTTYFHEDSVFHSDLNEYRIGRIRVSSGDLYYNGKLNDFRIYDHALSPLEVKKISQGLVLHFPLNKNGWGQDNLITVANNTIEGYQVSNFTKTTNVSVSEWGCNDAERVVGSGGSSPLVALLSNKEASTANTPYSYSVYVKNNHTTNFVSFVANTGGWATRKSNGEIWLPPGESDWMIVENSVGNGRLWIQFNFRTRTAGDAFDFTCWHYKIEIGEKATRWCPHSDSDLYTQLGINNNIEYDISGYKNNGQKIGTLTYSLNTPKYILSSIFDTAAHINLPIYLGASNLISDYTLSFWINRNNTDTTSHHTIITGPINAYINKGSSNIRFTWTHAVSESNKATNTWAASSYNINNSVWTHIALTFAGGLLKFYLNGEKVNTGDRTSTGQYIYGTRSSTIGSYQDENESFVGQISDIRVYVTALSEDDIKKLYESNKLG